MPYIERQAVCRLERDVGLLVTSEKTCFVKPMLRGHYLTLLVILVMSGAVRLIFSSSLSGNDDLSPRCSCALSMLDGVSILQQGHYCARLGMTLPMAAVFAIAGTGTVQISLLPALASAAAVLVAWRLGSLIGAFEGLAAAAAIGLFPMDVEYAGLAFPDVMQGVLVASAILCGLSARTIRSERADALAAAGGVLWAWAYYVKLDAFMLAPVLLIAIVLKLISWRHAIIMGCAAFILVGIELGAYSVSQGIRCATCISTAEEAMRSLLREWTTARCSRSLRRCSSSPTKLACSTLPGWQRSWLRCGSADGSSCSRCLGAWYGRSG